MAAVCYMQTKKDKRGLINWMKMEEYRLSKIKPLTKEEEINIGKEINDLIKEIIN